MKKKLIIYYRKFHIFFFRFYRHALFDYPFVNRRTEAMRLNSEHL